MNYMKSISSYPLTLGLDFLLKMNKIKILAKFYSIKIQFLKFYLNKIEILKHLKRIFLNNQIKILALLNKKELYTFY